MFEASQKIQAWFTECALAISDDFKQLVEWETPLGLHVVQPYTKPRKYIRTDQFEANKVVRI